MKEFRPRDKNEWHRAQCTFKIKSDIRRTVKCMYLEGSSHGSHFCTATLLDIEVPLELPAKFVTTDATSLSFHLLYCGGHWVPLETWLHSYTECHWLFAPWRLHSVEVPALSSWVVLCFANCIFLFTFCIILYHLALCFAFFIILFLCALFVITRSQTCQSLSSLCSVVHHFPQVVSLPTVLYCLLLHCSVSGYKVCLRLD